MSTVGETGVGERGRNQIVVTYSFQPYTTGLSYTIRNVDQICLTEKSFVSQSKILLVLTEKPALFVKTACFKGCVPLPEWT